MEKVTYVCAATGKREEGSPSELPKGWLIPPRDVSRDIEKEPLPRGTVLALSSENAWKQYWDNLWKQYWDNLVKSTLGQ